MFVGLDVSNRYDSVLVESEYILIRNWMKTSIDCAQLNLKKAVELQKQPLLNVVVKTTNGKVLSVLEFSYSLGILECRGDSQDEIVGRQFKRKRRSVCERDFSVPRNVTSNRFMQVPKFFRFFF